MNWTKVSDKLPEQESYYIVTYEFATGINVVAHVPFKDGEFLYFRDTVQAWAEFPDLEYWNVCEPDDENEKYFVLIKSQRGTYSVLMSNWNKIDGFDSVWSTLEQDVVGWIYVPEPYTEDE